MNKLKRLQKKKKRLAVGLMSGTSADAVDAVLAEISGSGPSVRIRQRAFVSLPYPKGYRKQLLHASLPGNSSVDEISTLNILVAHFLADAVNAVASKARIPLRNIDLIGSHGQTVHHLPSPQRIFGKTIRSTLQIGDPSTIAALTGITTVGNFRPADMAHGGQGAPLVPYFDYRMFRSRTKNRILLNIGGIANITFLKKGCSSRDIIAFDSGPGNMVIDGLMKRYYNREFDRDGAVARSGMLLPSLLSAMMKHRYFILRPPKSTGREVFGDAFIKTIASIGRHRRRQDIIATATEFTVLSLYDQIHRFILPAMKGATIDEIIVGGGGSRNAVLMELLRRYFEKSAVALSDDYGVSSDAKEALCFALLACETIDGIPSSLPSVTGASRSAVLGTIAVP